MSKEKLVVEVVAAHNLMPKDGQGSSTPFVEVNFENQRLRTQSKYNDLNPVWNEKLVFTVNDPLDIPYRIVEVTIFNEKKSGNSRNFLGKVRISGSSIAKQGEEVPQLYTLEKRSLFSHIRGEISLKIYFTNDDKVGTGTRTTIAGETRPANETTKQVSNKQEVKSQHQQLKQQQQQHQQKQQQQQQQQQNMPVQTSAQQEKPQQPPSQNQQRQPVEPKFNDSSPVTTSGATGVSATGTGFHDFSLKETNPHLGGISQNKDKTSWTYDLVEQMQYLYVRVVKARDLPATITGTCDPYAEVKVGNYRGVTKHVEKKSNPEWNLVFAFSKDCIQASTMEVVVKDRATIKDDFLGRICFELSEVPTRVPPDSPLAPQWYRMEDKKGENKVKGEIMLSVWMGTQADEAFSEAWHSKAANVHSDGLTTIKSKVYLSPKLWYLRVCVIEAQDLVFSDNGRYPELTVKTQVGNQVLRTMVALNKTNNPFWNEDMMFVVAEPFEDYLMVSVEDRFGPNKEEVLGKLVIPLSAIERRIDDRTGTSRWFGLDKQGMVSETEQSKKPSSRFGSRIHLRLCLDGGYHVLDESTLYSSDLRPTARQLWKPRIGILEIGILSANSLLPMKIKDGKGTTDAYCVAKYGQKWIRTRTVIDSLTPKWNEQYTWEVFDPCTVITIGVFDNCHLHATTEKGNGSGFRDLRIGKVRIRLSTLETEKVYTHSYPLLILHSSGVKKMGELHLAIRFSCSSLPNMLHLYSLPLLPKMHYLHPLSVNQLETLRYQAMNIVAMRMSRAEPPLWKEVVEYMLDLDSHTWSMRKSKANFFRMMSVISGLVSVGRWVEWVCSWKRPMVSVLVLVLYLILVVYPEFILPTGLFYMFLIGLWRYRFRPRQPLHMDARLSQADSVYADELDEEFDVFPTGRSGDVLRMRYDRLRSVAGRIQMVVGNLATQGERFQALLSWRDTRATFLFLSFCLVAAVGFYAVPMQVVVGGWGVYVLRPPRFRSRLPSPALNFFRRLPSRADGLL